MKERVIVSDVRRHPTAMADETKAYVEATSSNVNLLLVENDKMANELQAAR